jgi:hypothetical protein
LHLLSYTSGALASFIAASSLTLTMLLQYESTYDSNARQVRILEACFRLAIVFLVAEVAFWLAALTRGAP